MTRTGGGLTPYLAAALRLGGPGCERAFLAREERSILRGAHPKDIQAVRGLGPLDDDPAPRPAFRILKRAA